MTLFPKIFYLGPQCTGPRGGNRSQSNFLKIPKFRSFVDIYLFIDTIWQKFPSFERFGLVYDSLKRLEIRQNTCFAPFSTNADRSLILRPANGLKWQIFRRYSDLIFIHYENAPISRFPMQNMSHKLVITEICRLFNDFLKRKFDI